jgi:transcriptional regulator with XRE-family HTH domain
MLNLKRERLKRGWSLQTLGFYTGIQGAEISKIERGILVPYPSQRERLARELGLHPDELL